MRYTNAASGEEHEFDKIGELIDTFGASCNVCGDFRTVGFCFMDENQELTMIAYCQTHLFELLENVVFARKIVGRSHS